ncbi:hypothetical protein DB347_04070 [Opitutaceae bacterium EW11]|nr:hypothetical protein DB347_04070 [Opitutaceae bacterium EW11]
MSKSRLRLLAALTLPLAPAIVPAVHGQSAVAMDDGGSTEAQKLEKVVVTGSNIPSTLASGDTSIAPVVSLDRSRIDATGFQNTAQLLHTLTVANQGAVPISNNATGFTPSASAVSIHGLGPEATLVLINGHRIANYPIGQSGTTAFVDLNTIPLSAIERIDVLKEGASAMYGADAVAGVTNIILRKGYDGSESFVSYQNTTNKDSSQFTANVLSGVSSEKGSLLVGFNYQSRAAIMQRDRAYSAVPAFLSTNSSPINLQISQAAYDEALGLPAGTGPAGVSKSVFYATPGPLTDDGLPTASNNHGTTPAGDYIYSSGRSSVYNYNQDAQSYPSWERYGMILNGERKLFGLDSVVAYFDGSYQSNMTETQLAPAATGSFTTPGQTELVIPARTATPLAMADGRDRAAPIGAYNPFNPFNTDIAGGTRFRLKEFGNRIFHDTTNAFMGTTGIRISNIADKFDVDAGFRYSEIVFRGKDTLVSSSRFNRVLNAADPIFNPASDQYVGTTIPYNPFGYYVNAIENNAKLVDFARVVVHDVNTSRLGNGFLNVSTADLFTLPAGGVGAAAGVDYRVESLAQSPDVLNHTGDIIGSSPAAITDHTRKVVGVYAELSVPIVAEANHVPGVHSLGADVAARYENFLTNSETTTVPKAGLRYQPFDESLTLRASASKGFLEPSLYQLYAGPVASLLGLIDPRTGEDLPEVPTTTAGNRKLAPEHTKSYNVGVVWAPDYWHLQGLTTSVDVWRVDRKGTASIDLQNLLDRNFGTAPGGLQPGESVVLGPDGGIEQVNGVYINAGDTIAYGVDMGVSYRLKPTPIGKFGIAADATYLSSFKQSFVPGTPLVQRVDQTTDGEGQDAYLRWKGTIQLDWSLASYRANITGHYLNGFHDFDLDGNDRRAGSSFTWDAQFSYAIRKGVNRFLDETTFTVGAFNVFDRNPPLSQYYGNNPQNYPGFIYTAEGRMLYVSVGKKF